MAELGNSESNLIPNGSGFSILFISHKDKLIYINYFNIFFNNSVYLKFIIIIIILKKKSLICCVSFYRSLTLSIVHPGVMNTRP